MENLTKEQLLSLLKNKEEEEILTSEPSKCIYKPVRGNQKECTSNASTPFGFCKKHSRTVQAKKAREKWEELNKPKEEPSTELLVEPEETEKEVALEEKEISLEKKEFTGDSVEKRLAKLEKETKALKTRKAPTHIKKGSKKPVIRKKTITPNIWGRYEDPETHIVFDPKAKGTFAYGVQAKNGDLLGLGPREILICQNNGWNFPDPGTSSEESSDSEEYTEEYSEESEDSSSEEELTEGSEESSSEEYSELGSAESEEEYSSYEEESE